MHVRKSDEVLIQTGKDKGKRGKVLRVNVEKNRVVVEKINIMKKHTRPTMRQPQGGIFEKEAPMDASKVMVVCPHCGAPSRMGGRVVGERKVRYCKKCNEDI